MLHHSPLTPHWSLALMNSAFAPALGLVARGDGELLGIVGLSLGVSLTAAIAALVDRRAAGRRARDLAVSWPLRA